MSIVLPAATRHSRDMTEKLLKAKLNPYTHKTEITVISTVLDNYNNNNFILFQVDNIFGTSASLTDDPQLQDDD